MKLQDVVFDFSNHTRKTVNENTRETRELNELYANEDHLHRLVIQVAYRHFEQCRTYTV